MSKEGKGLSAGAPPPSLVGEDAFLALQLGKLKRSQDSLASANGSHRNVVKNVEAKGGMPKAMKEALAIAKGGTAKVKDKLAELTHLFHCLMILGVPVEREQLDLFKVAEGREPAEDRAKAHGRYCALMGLGMTENPHGAESEAGQAWIASWHAGNAERTGAEAADQASTPGATTVEKAAAKKAAAGSKLN